MKWYSVNCEDIPINTDMLITDGVDVFVGFYDSMFEWHMHDQELCESVQFDVTHWMEFPDPPCV